MACVLLCLSCGLVDEKRAWNVTHPHVQVEGAVISEGAES